MEKSFYLTLPATSWTNPYMGYDLYLQNTLYWEYNTNTIHIIGDKVRSYQWDARVFDQVIQCSLYDFTKEGKLFYKNNNGNYQEIYNFTSLNNYGKDIDPRKVKFRIYYTPLGETVSLTVPKTEPQEHQFTIPVSQQQPIVSSQAYGKNLQALANRTGVPVRIVKRKVNTLDQIRKLGSYWQETDNKSNRTGNIYTLTSQEIVLQGGYAICTERWSKNWMMQSEYVGINREFRSWNIPADIVQRNLHYQDYCYITSDKDFDKDGKFTKDCDLTD
ncbi:MAG: hypothetical protein J1G02_06735, partial [Clostridiales bacterium]|nr:hypothetical protein [Clostridiales bacterium]